MELFTRFSNKIINNRIIDCHVHLFDANGKTPLNHNINRVGFMDTCFCDLDMYTGNKSEILYNNYITEELSSSTILLSTAPDPDQVIHIYENNKEYIKGFGELKCYDYSFANNEYTKLEFKDLKWVYDICNYLKQNKLQMPVYIHYSLDANNWEQLKKLFVNFPTISFILCHCGIGTDDEYGFSLCGSPYDSFCFASNLSKLDNVYLEISYTAANWIYSKNPVAPVSLNSPLCAIHPSKILLGTDCNNQQFVSDPNNGSKLYQEQKKIFLDLYKYYGNYNYINIRKLFKL